MEFVRLVSCDGIVFGVDLETAKQSAVLRMILEDNGFTDSDDDLIPLPKVNARTLRRIIQWLDRNKATESEPTDEECSALVEWTSRFFDVDQATLFDIIMAANYLEIGQLKEVACRLVASMISEKQPEQLRRAFRIVNDFTREEEERVRRENDWASLD